MAHQHLAPAAIEYLEQQQSRKPKLLPLGTAKHINCSEYTEHHNLRLGKKYPITGEVYLHRVTGSDDTWYVLKMFKFSILVELWIVVLSVRTSTVTPPLRIMVATIHRQEGE